MKRNKKIHMCIFKSAFETTTLIKYYYSLESKRTIDFSFTKKTRKKEYAKSI